MLEDAQRKREIDRREVKRDGKGWKQRKERNVKA